MTRLGFQVVVVRDLTDSMYDPRTRPFVSHARGTELVIEHIESRWCPSIMSGDLTQVIAGTDSPSKVSSAHPTSYPRCSCYSTHSFFDERL